MGTALLIDFTSSLTVLGTHGHLYKVSPLGKDLQINIRTFLKLMEQLPCFPLVAIHLPKTTALAILTAIFNKTFYILRGIAKKYPYLMRKAGIII